MGQTDFSKIVLTDEQQAVFAKFMCRDKVYLTFKEYKLLSAMPMLKSTIDGKSTWFDAPDGGICEISEFGKKYRTYLKEKRKTERTESFRFWFPTIISIIALIGGYRQELAWLLQAIAKLLK